MYLLDFQFTFFNLLQLHYKVRQSAKFVALPQKIIATIVFVKSRKKRGKDFSMKVLNSK